MHFINLINKEHIVGKEISGFRKEIVKDHNYFNFHDYTFTGNTVQVDNVVVGYNPEKREIVVREGKLEKKEVPVEFREDKTISESINGKKRKFDDDILLLIDNVTFAVNSPAYISVIQLGYASLILLHAGTLEIEVNNELIPQTRIGKIPKKDVKRRSITAEELNKYCLYTDISTKYNMAPESVVGIIVLVQGTKEKIRDCVMCNGKITAEAVYSEFLSFNVKLALNKEILEARLYASKFAKDANNEELNIFQILDDTYKKEAISLKEKSIIDIKEKREKNRILTNSLLERDSLKEEETSKKKKSKKKEGNPEIIVEDKPIEYDSAEKNFTERIEGKKSKRGRKKKVV